MMTNRVHLVITMATYHLYMPLLLIVLIKTTTHKKQTPYVMHRVLNILVISLDFECDCLLHVSIFKQVYGIEVRYITVKIAK